MGKFSLKSHGTQSMAMLWSVACVLGLVLAGCAAPSATETSVEPNSGPTDGHEASPTHRWRDSYEWKGGVAISGNVGFGVPHPVDPGTSYEFDIGAETTDLYLNATWGCPEPRICSMSIFVWTPEGDYLFDNGTGQAGLHIVNPAAGTWRATMTTSFKPTIEPVPISAYILPTGETTIETIRR